MDSVMDKKFPLIGLVFVMLFSPCVAAQKNVMQNLCCLANLLYVGMLVGGIVYMIVLLYAFVETLKSSEPTKTIVGWLIVMYFPLIGLAAWYFMGPRRSDTPRQQPPAPPQAPPMGQ